MSRAEVDAAKWEAFYEKALETASRLYASRGRSAASTRARATARTWRTSAFARRKFERAGDRGAAGLGRLFVRGEPGSEIVEDARPREGEPVIDKTANDAFIGTDLDRLLRLAGISRLVRSFVESVCVEGGLFGAVAESAQFLDALRGLDG
ncbi:isochorismatase-like protein [Aureococcus anophagefferens]|nr:isochorismatase-like protein [Aureococcus anophagefferens]